MRRAQDGACSRTSPSISSPLPIPRPAWPARVRALTSHPVFSLANPNRVRALIGNFAQANQTQFNRADGAGYAFHADTMIALDAINPQVAARLMTAFRSWR